MRISYSGILPSRPISKLPCFTGGRLAGRRQQSATTRADTPRYKHIDDVEGLDNYRSGGYHPIQIGNYLHSWYRIVHKLGQGSYSTIWLARDERLSRYVAIKVGTAASARKEINILKHLADSASSERGFTTGLVPPLLDHFDVHGPNGSHPCVVTSPAMCSLADVILASDYRPFQIDIARSLAAQLAMAVAYMHKAGFIHGDLHFGNLLLQQPAGLDDLTDQQLYDKYDAAEPEPVVREDEKPLSQGVPPHVYVPIWMGKPSHEVSLSEAKLLLTDFGTAFRPDEESRFVSYTPLEIRPPEARFEPTTPLGFASDIWSLGCTIWAILGVKPFLGAWLFGSESAAASQVDALGPMPDEWWDSWEAKTKTDSFVGNGKPRAGKDVWTFEKRFEDCIQRPRREDGMEVVSDDERVVIFEMIKDMLKFRPCDRMSARQVLETEWMRRWALPAAERSRGAGTS